MTPVRRTVLAVLVPLTLILAGCSGGSGGDTGAFDLGKSGDISCMEHQTATPGSKYTGGTESDSAAILNVFRYYLKNGTKDYCDGKPPTSTDQKWAQLVVDLGGNADSVAPILSGS